MEDNYKAGDAVAYRRGDFQSTNTVARTTKTLIILENGMRFRRSDHMQIGRSYISASAYRLIPMESYLSAVADKAERQAKMGLVKETIQRLNDRMGYGGTVRLSAEERALLEQLAKLMVYNNKWRD